MKVDITLTVGGNDVTIDYSEGKELFNELKALYEPSSTRYPEDTYAAAPATESQCGETKEKTRPSVEDQIVDLDELKDLGINEEDLSNTIAESLQDPDIEARVKQMTDLISQFQSK